MPRKKLVFIASSSKAVPLAERVAKYLETESKSGIEVKPWWDTSQIRLSRAIFEELGKQASRCDFAVVFLTQDDYEEKKGKKLFSPRDNTVFELGLFAGEIGLERCVMVVQTEPEALPSDLQGIRYTQVSPELNFANPEELNTAVTKAAPEVLAAIEPEACFDHPKLPVISIQTLAEKERATDENGDLKLENGRIAVVVNSVQPVEQSDSIFSNTILENMKSGAHYEYYYGPTSENIHPTANLLQSIALGSLRPAKATPDELRRMMKEKWNQVWPNVELMKRCLSVHFRKRPPLQFCVHNAENPDLATCYLRCAKLPADDSADAKAVSFVRWADEREAKEIADELICSCTERNPERCIFHSTTDFPLSILSRSRKEILNVITDRFPRDLPSSDQKALDKVWLDSWL